MGWKTVECTLTSLEYEGLVYYFIENPYYFKRSSPYGYHDDAERFVYFSKAVLEGIKYMEDFTPDILHCNDWHTALMIPLKDAYYGEEAPYRSIKTVFTIHNMLFQGNFGKEALNMLGLSEDKYYTEDMLKHYEGISFMKGGLAAADKITTVSRTYAEEIKLPWFSYGLETMIKKRSRDLKGIVNGIDYEAYNPEKDIELFYNYSSKDFHLKAENKLKLQKELKLTEDKSIPLISIISRLSDQKGIELIQEIMPSLMDMNIQLVIVGGGFESYENMFKHYSSKYPQKVSVNIPFNRELSKKVYAASDIFLMPSQFEACGIGQLIAMRYGAVPVVRKTGGLKDTVKMYDENKGTGSGFLFKNYDSQEFLHEIKRSLKLFNQKDNWNKLVKRNMNKDSSWKSSAEEYMEIYNKCQAPDK
nr:glycogen/starch synthase [Clostridium polynesiense]